jgi:poly-beta-1,6-N-acetyl-D-glucosamine synthase
MVNCAYLVISPTRDEANYLEKTIASMVAQSIRPELWVIVDDGSTDRTGEIADKAAAQYPWIKAVHRSNRGFRQAGSGVMDAFYAGLELVTGREWEFLVKLDADVSFDPTYFERCFEHFEAQPRLGIAGGTVCQQIGDRLEPESKVDPAFHVRGATKIYRRACWEQIGGLIREPGWDTVDELKANMLGWKTLTFPEVRLVHHRFTGKAYGTWNDWVKGGRANYIAGYHPVFMAVKCAKRVFDFPYLVGGAGLFWGYFTSLLRRAPRVPDQALIRYFQREQMNRLLFRKSLWQQD